VFVCEYTVRGFSLSVAAPLSVNFLVWGSLKQDWPPLECNVVGRSDQHRRLYVASTI